MPLTLSNSAALSWQECDALQEGDEIRSIDGLRMDLFLTNCQIKVSSFQTIRIASSFFVVLSNLYVLKTRCRLV